MKTIDDNINCKSSSYSPISVELSSWKDSFVVFTEIKSKAETIPIAGNLRISHINILSQHVLIWKPSHDKRSSDRASKTYIGQLVRTHFANDMNFQVRLKTEISGGVDIMCIRANSTM